MKVAVLGPLCKDRNIISGGNYEKPGGVTYYSGVALGHLGVDTVVLGSCGPDFDNWPASCPAQLIRLPAEGTIEFINEYSSPDSNERTQRVAVFRNSLTVEAVDSAWPEGVDHAILGPLLHDNFSLDLIRHLAGHTELALAAQGTVRYPDKDRITWKRPDAVLPMLPFCRYVALDERELSFISGRRNLDDGAGFLLNSGATNLIVTKGNRGSVLFVEGDKYDIPAFPARKVADPTGAGDTFLAGYIRALELFDSPERCGRFAAMAATISIESSGAFTGSTEEVLQRLGW